MRAATALLVLLVSGHLATLLLRPPSPGSALEAAWFAGAKISPLIWGGQWWRVVIAPLHHLTPAHLAVNAVMIALMGGLCARMLGAAASVGVFLGTAWLSTLTSAWLNPEAWSLGASGGGYGLTGALIGALAAGPHLKNGRSPAVLMAAAGLIGLHIAQGGPEADRTAHGAGLLFGFLMGGCPVGAHRARAGHRREPASRGLRRVGRRGADRLRRGAAVDAGGVRRVGASGRRTPGRRRAPAVSVAAAPGWVARAPAADAPDARCITNGFADACLLPSAPSDALETSWFGTPDCPPEDRRPDDPAGEIGWHLRRRSLAGADASHTRTLWTHVRLPVAFAVAHLPEFEIHPGALPALVALRESVDCPGFP